MLEKEFFVRYKMLHPRDLYQPMLPYRCGGRLIFYQCRLSAESISEEKCDHEMVSKRALVTTCVVDEMRIAIEGCYRLRRIH